MGQEPDIETIKTTKNEIPEIITDETATPVHDVGNGYVEFNKGLFKVEALKEIKPELFAIHPDSVVKEYNSNFGTKFPRIAKKGDIFVRVDVLPNRVFKFDGSKWLEQNKNISQTYLNKNYIEFLIGKIEKGEYDLDTLNDFEKIEIENHIKEYKI